MTLVVYSTLFSLLSLYLFYFASYDIYFIQLIRLNIVYTVRCHVSLNSGIYPLICQLILDLIFLPKCNSALQTEKDLFNPKFKSLPKNCFFVPKIPQNV